MSQNISVSLSNECAFYINELKKKDSFFNVSKFFNMAIIEYYNKTIKVNPRSTIKEEKLQELEQEIKQIKEEINEKETEEETRKEEEEENKRLKEKRDLSSKYLWMSNVQYFYGLDEKETRILADEYYSLPSQNKPTLWQFMEEKHYKEIR
jgi:TolA-binding protein